MTIEEIVQMDTEIRELQAVYAKTQIVTGLELAKRLKAFEDGKLYLKLDEKSYPSFPAYLQSIGRNYKTVRELIGLFESYVLVAGFSIKELADIGYSKLTVIKPKFFKKEQGQYKLMAPKEEVKKWVEEAKSDITQEDLRQKVREDLAGEHAHDWQRVIYQYCRICKLREPVYEKTK